MKRLSFVTGLVGLAILSVACSGAENDVPPPFASAEPDFATRLESDIGAPVFAAQDGPHGFAMAQGQARVIGTSMADIATWVAKYATDLGVADGTPIRPVGMSEASEGFTHASFALGPDGAASPYEIDVVLDAEGRFASLTGDVPPRGSSFDVRIDANAAKTRMNELLKSQAYEGAAVVVEPKLAYALMPNGVATLAYEAAIYDGSPITMTISAFDGSLLAVGADALMASAPAKGIGGYAEAGSFASRTLPHEWSVDWSPTPYGSGTRLVRVAEGGNTEIATRQFGGYDVEFKLVTNDVTSTSGAYDATGHDVTHEAKGSAVDAHHHVAAIDLDFRAQFGQGIGKRPDKEKSGVETITVIVHQNKLHALDTANSIKLNAAYSEVANAIVVGDGGDGGAAYRGRTMLPPSASIDVLAHEAAHSLLTKRGLKRQGEHGVIQEGYADVLGKLYEHRVFKTSTAVSPKTFGTWLFADGNGMRDLARPSRVAGGFGTPAADAMNAKAYACPPGDRDQGCVHARATVIGHAFYLMTFGGRNQTNDVLVPTGLGWQKSEELWQWLMPKGNFVSLAEVNQPSEGVVFHAPRSIKGIAEAQITRTIQLQLRGGNLASAAKDLTAVVCAWEAVGVLSHATIAAMVGSKIPFGVCPKAAAESPCVGRPDGMYCDTERTWNAFRCKGGMASAAPCGSDKKCVSNGPDYQDSAAVGADGQGPKCE